MSCPHLNFFEIFDNTVTFTTLESQLHFLKIKWRPHTLAFVSFVNIVRIWYVDMLNWTVGGRYIKLIFFCTRLLFAYFFFLKNVRKKIESFVIITQKKKYYW